LESLRQKHPATALTTEEKRPSQYVPAHEVNLETASHVQHFLEIFITFFSTVLYCNPDRLSKTPPKYFEAKLFELPDVAPPAIELAAAAVVRRYAEVSEGF
jgi:hypothetical protein